MNGALSNSPDDTQRDHSPTEALHHQIEKDVVRTDRSTSYYKGEDNTHYKTLM